MPYKTVISGIYSITAPDGKKYVGSSNNIYRRWREHRGNLRRGSHHSKKLQAAWNKYNVKLQFAIVCECPIDLLIEMEQRYIDSLKASLNTTIYVNNVWCNPETREKLTLIHQSSAWKKSRSEIATRVVESRRIQVDCSNGKKYASFSEAAKDFGVKPSGIKALTQSQRQGVLGVKFKLASDDWKNVPTHYEQVWITRQKNGNQKHSEAAKEKMRIAKIGYIPCNKGVPHSNESKTKMAESQKRIQVFDSFTGKTYQSCSEASRETSISRTQVRRLLSCGKRFVEIGIIQNKASR